MSKRRWIFGLFLVAGLFIGPILPGPLSPAYATVTDTYTPVQLTGDGSDTTFDFDFKVFNATDLVVAIVNPTTLVGTAQTYGVDYTVSLNTSTTGGTVTFTTAPTDTYYVSIRREVPVTQTTDIPAGGLFRETAIENALDKAILLLQQQGESLDRALLQNPYSTALDLVFPAASANKLIGWNTAGTGLENKTALDADIQAACEAAQTAAELAETNAETAETNAETAETNAETAETNAETAEANAEAAQATVEGYVTAGSIIKGDGTVNPTNLLSNGDFEVWSAGASAIPDGWATAGWGGEAFAREGTIVKLGTYSSKLTNQASTRGGFVQHIETVKGIDYWKGRKITFSCWVYATVANRVNIRIYEATSDEVISSSYHTGNSTWQLLKVTKTVAATSTTVSLECEIQTGAQTSAYFDGAMVVEGESAFAFSDKPVNDGVLTDYGAVSTVTGWAASPTVNILTKKLGKTVFVHFYITGTSNDTVVSFTVPYTSANITPTGGGVAYYAVDNSAALTTPCRIVSSQSSDVITIYKDMATGAWTNSGAKTVYGNFFYEAAN